MFEKGKPERNVILCVDGCFHGRTISMLSATSKKENRTGFGPLPGGFRHIPFNDLNSLAEQFAAKDVAAIMIEPVLGEGGAKSISKEFFKKAQELANNNNCLVISDEVQTGIARTGKMLATDFEDARPDILILGKALSGGVLPVSAVLADDEVMMCIKPGEHGSTFGGNPLASALAKRSLELLYEENLIENSRVMGDYFKEQLTALNSELIVEIRGMGLWLGVEIDQLGAEQIASRSRGTPRIANRLLRRARDYCEVKADGRINADLVNDAMDLMEVDVNGFDYLDRKFLAAIIEKFNGGPV